MKNTLRALARSFLLCVMCAGSLFAQTFITNFPDTDTGADILATLGTTLYVSGSFENIVVRDGVGRTVNRTSGAQIFNWGFGDKVYTAIPDGAGGFFVGGEFTWVDNSARSHIVRLDANGAINASFAPTALDGSVHSMLLVGGALIIGGEFTTVNGTGRTRLASLNPANGALNALNVSITGTPTATEAVRVTALATNSTGTDIWIGGHFTTVGGASHKNMARIALAGTGTVNATYSTSADSTVYVMRMNPNDTRLFIGGEFTLIGANGRNRIARIDAGTGAATSGWNPGANATVFDIEVNSANTVVTACGAFTQIGGKTRNRMARLDVADGDVRTGFVISGAVNGAIRAFINDGNNNWYCAGGFTTFDGVTRNYLAFVDANGNVDGTWNPGSGTWTEMRTVAFDQGFLNSGVFVGGRDDFSFASAHVGKIVNNVAGFPDMQASAPPWPKGFAFRSVGGSNVGLAVGPDALLFGGNGSRSDFIEWTVGGNVTATQFRPTHASNGKFWNIAMNGTSKVLVVGEFTDLERFDGTNWGGTVTRNNIAEVDLSTSPISFTSFDPNANGIVYQIVVSGTTAFVAGTFTQIGGQSRAGLAAIDLTTGTVTSWNPSPSPSGSVEVIRVNGDGTKVFLGGSFTQIGGQSRNRIACVNNTDGSAVAGFDPNANNTVYALALDGGVLYAGGAFTTIGGTTRNRAAALHATNGTVDANWNVNCNNAVFDIAIYNSQVVLAGSFTSIMDRTKRGLAAVSLASQPPPKIARNAGAGKAAAYLHVYPNPSTGTAAVEFIAPEDGYAELTVYTSLGQEVARVFAGQAAAGERYTLELGKYNLIPGVYLVRLATPDAQMLERLVVMK